MTLTAVLILLWSRCVGPVLVVLAALAGANQSAPSLLRGALARHPELRLISPDSDFPGEYTEAQIRDLGCWPPWLQVDLDRDGRMDVAAVVAVASPSGVKFGVVSVFAAREDSIRWIVKPQKHSIFGVATGYARGAVTPLFCLECDANGWMTWSGRSFEPDLYVVGDSVAIAAIDEGARLGLFASPQSGATMTKVVEPCTRGVVVKVAGTPGKRWYFVRLGDGGASGWVPAEFAFEVNCTGE